MRPPAITCLLLVMASAGFRLVSGSAVCQSDAWPMDTNDVTALWDSNVSRLLDQLVPCCQFARRSLDGGCCAAKRSTRRLERACAAGLSMIYCRPVVHRRKRGFVIKSLMLVKPLLLELVILSAERLPTVPSAELRSERIEVNREILRSFGGLLTIFRAAVVLLGVRWYACSRSVSSLPKGSLQFARMPVVRYLRLSLVAFRFGLSGLSCQQLSSTPLIGCLTNARWLVRSRRMFKSGLLVWLHHSMLHYSAVFLCSWPRHFQYANSCAGESRVALPLFASYVALVVLFLCPYLPLSSSR